MTAFKLVTAPSIEPVTLEEMKSHGRIDVTTDDVLIAALIVAARQWAERYTCRGFIQQSWRLWMDVPSRDRVEWWDGLREAALVSSLRDAIVLPRSPLMSVTSVQFFDEKDASVVWDAANYFVDTAREPGRVVLRSGATWPVPDRTANGLMIEYVVGFGAAAADVPEPIRLAIKQLALHWYEHRGEELMPGAASDEISSRYGAINVPMLIQALLNPYRVM